MGHPVHTLAALTDLFIVGSMALILGLAVIATLVAKLRPPKGPNRD